MKNIGFFLGLEKICGIEEPTLDRIRADVKRLAYNALTTDREHITRKYDFLKYISDNATQLREIDTAKLRQFGDFNSANIGCLACFMDYVDNIYNRTIKHHKADLNARLSAEVRK